MKTAYNNHEYAKKVAFLLTQAAHVNPPPIPFRREKPKEEDEIVGEDEKVKKIKIKLDPKDKDSEEFETRCFIFESGDAERWAKWKIQFEELVRDVPLDTGEKKIKYAQMLLGGTAREKFTNKAADLRFKDDKMQPQDVFDETIQARSKDYFGSEHAYRRQKQYLRYHVFMMEMSLADFRAELLRQNRMLAHFPIPEDKTECEPFDDNELVEILDRAKRIEWQRDLLTSNIDPFSMSLDNYYKYLEKLEAKHVFDDAMRQEKKNKEKKKEAGKSEGESKDGGKKRKRGKDRKKGEKGERKEACKHCGRFHPAPDDKCWSLPGNAKDRPNKRPRGNGENMFSALQMETVVQALAKKQSKKDKGKDKPKRQVSFQVQKQADSSSNESSDSDSDYMDCNSENEHSFAIRTSRPGIEPNRKIARRLTTEIVVEALNPRGESYVLRTLLDTGTSRSIVLKNFVTLSQLGPTGKTSYYLDDYGRQIQDGQSRNDPLQNPRTLD